MEKDEDQWWIDGKARRKHRIKISRGKTQEIPLEAFAENTEIH